MVQADGAAMVCNCLRVANVSECGSVVEGTSWRQDWIGTASEKLQVKQKLEMEPVILSSPAIIYVLQTLPDSMQVSVNDPQISSL